MTDVTAARQELEQPPAPLAERAYAAILDRLIMLTIPPMAPIDDAALGQSLGVGRTPVREALKRLEVDRLVITYPRRGTFATGVDINDLAYISEIRGRLEPLAARRAAENAAKPVRSELAELADTLQGIDAGALTQEELMHWDLRVHRTIYRAAGNPHLQDTLVRYDNLATRIFCLFLPRMAHFERHVEEHVGLLRAIAEGNADLAERLAHEHIIGFEKAIRAII